MIWNWLWCLCLVPAPKSKCSTEKKKNSTWYGSNLTTVCSIKIRWLCSHKQCTIAYLYILWPSPYIFDLWLFVIDPCYLIYTADSIRCSFWWNTKINCYFVLAIIDPFMYNAGYCDFLCKFVWVHSHPLLWLNHLHIFA